jgi:hypothetical protein
MTLRRLDHALALLALSVVFGCSGSNEPSVMSSSATTAGTSPTKASDSAAAGSSSAGKPSTSSAAPSNSSAGKSGSTGAAPSTSSAGQGGGDSKASPAAAVSSSGSFSPLCSDVPPTAAGGAPTKGGACSATDAQTCYKTCGPQSAGFKSETCTNGAYVEQTGCSFPDVDYACYKIPGRPDATCPKDAPQATMPCDVAPCTVCNAGGNYLDSSGASKAGYCVCPMAGDSGMRKWSCASNTAWPCPSGRGC